MRRQTERGRAFAFLTCEPNSLVAPLQPKAMPLILGTSGYDRSLEDSFEGVCELIRPYPSDRMRVQEATPRIGGEVEVVG